MREDIVKKLCIVLIVILVAFLVVRGTQYKRRQEEHREKLQEADKKISLLQVEKTKKQQELEEIKKKYDKKKKGKTCMTVAFEQMTEEIYTMVYPLFRRYDMKGVFVMQDGKIPGDTGVMTREQYEILVENGWEAAMGASAKVSLKDADHDKVLEWQEYVINYIQALESAGIERPTTYCFKQGEYKKEYEDFLVEQGFEVIRHYGEEGLPIVTSELTKPILRVGAIIIQSISAESKATLSSAIYSSDSIAISTRYASTTGEDGQKKDNIEELTELLLTLVDFRVNDAVSIKTFRELDEYKKEVASKIEKNEKKREKEMKAVQKEIKEINEEMQKIMKEDSLS